MHVVLALQTVSSLSGLAPSHLFIAYDARDWLLVSLLLVQDCAEEKEEEERKKRQKTNAHSEHSSSSLKKVVHVVQRDKKN